MAGRRESPLDPSAGPVARFAAELRKLRAEAESPTYRVMAQRTGQGASTLSQAAGGERMPTLPVVLAYVHACGGDAVEWEERWHQATAEKEAEPRTEDGDAEPPYRGLARFEPADADLFFGRDQLTDHLFELTSSRRFTAVFGPSGSGKSSLLRAGLIPRLRNPDTAGPRAAALRVLTPASTPCVPTPSALYRRTPRATPGCSSTNSKSSTPCATIRPSAAGSSTSSWPAQIRRADCAWSSPYAPTSLATAHRTPG